MQCMCYVLSGSVLKVEFTVLVAAGNYAYSSLSIASMALDVVV